MIRPDCVALGRPPRRTYSTLAGASLRALSASLDRWACARWRRFGSYSRREEGAYQGIGNRRATPKAGQIPPALRVAAAPACRRCCSSVADSRSVPSSRRAAKAGGARDEHTPIYRTRYYQAGPSPASRRPGVRKAGLSRSPESARGSVLLFVKRGTLNVERAGRRPAAEAPPTFRIRPIRPIRIHWILRQHWQKINTSFGLDSRSCNLTQITAHIEFFDHIYFCLLSGLPGSEIGVQAKQFYSLTEESTCFTEHFSIGHHSLLWDFWP